MNALKGLKPCLRTFPLGEGDRLVSFLDRNLEAARGARGARCPRVDSVRLSSSSLISNLVFERETRELVRINQCELIESFRTCRGLSGRGLFGL